MFLRRLISIKGINKYQQQSTITTNFHITSLFNKNDNINKRYYCSSYFDYDQYPIDHHHHHHQSHNEELQHYSFDYGVDIDIPINPSTFPSKFNTNYINNDNSNNNNNNKPVNNNKSNNNNLNIKKTASHITADKLPKKIKITTRKSTIIVNNNVNNNNVKLKTIKDLEYETKESEILNKINKLRMEQQEQKEQGKTIFDKQIQQPINQDIDNNDNLDNQNSIELEHSLTMEQQKIVNLIVDGGKNVFFTGSAGTGKSFVLKHLVSKLRKKYPKSVFVTAATGIAAVNIGGTTLHSFAGIKLGQATAQRLAVEILQSKKLSQKWIDCRVLIIDEISMIDSELFEKLDSIGQMVRGNNQAFGGIQLVLVGDFFQLPPVYGNYAFESRAWRKSVDLCVELTTVMRQKEIEFIDILNRLRVGDIDDSTVTTLLNRCSNQLDISNGVLPTKLYSTNASVDEENQVSLEKLTGDPHHFEAVDSGSKELIELLDRDCPAMKKLTLKIGAQVVLLRKIDKSDGLVNGSRGVVIDFIKVKGLRKNSKFHKNNPYAPVVLFNDGQKVIVPPSEWGVWSEDKAYRLQIPLKLAWALTIHRAQGMTLDKVECKLSQTFACGQGYVALSRVKSLNGLYLKDLKLSAIKTSGKVVSFDKKIVRSINKSHI